MLFIFRIVTMEFYGKNDLTLGIFLERYCFRYSKRPVLGIVLYM